MANFSIWTGKRRSRTQDYMPILLWKSDRFDALSSDDDDVQVLYSSIVLTKVTLTFISIHFMFGIKVDVIWHKITSLTLFFCCCCCCLFVLFCFLIHKRFTQNFRFVFYKVELQAGSVRNEQDSEMDAQKT